MYKCKKFLPITVNENTYHHHKAMVIEKYIKSAIFKETDNNLIALYGEWGSGKSSIFKTLKEKLEIETEYIPLIFEAWKYEKDKNLPLSLYEFILDKIIPNKESFKIASKEGINKSLYSFAKGFSFSIGIVSYDISKTTEELEKEDAYSLYTSTENFIDEFQKQLDEYRNNKKIIIFIDDLDRCDDENVVTLISALKLAFALKNIIFICGVDKAAVIESLKLKYQDINKAEIFLEKVFPVDYTLMDMTSDHISAYDSDFPELKLDILFQLKIYNSRKITKIFNKYLSLLYLTGDKNPLNERKKRVILFIVLACKESNIPFEIEAFKFSGNFGGKPYFPLNSQNKNGLSFNIDLFSQNLDIGNSKDFFVNTFSEKDSEFFNKIVLEY